MPHPLIVALLRLNRVQELTYYHTILTKWEISLDMAAHHILDLIRFSVHGFS